MGPKSLLGHTPRAYPLSLIINSLLIKMPPASRGASGGLGLVLPTFLPVGILIALVRVRADVSAHILHAHDAQRTVLGSANVIVHVVSAADAAAGLGLLAVSADLPAVLTRASGLGFGAGGFFVVVSGAHAYIVTHTGECVFKSPQYFF